MKSKVEGTCALCQELASLQESHLMPRHFYKAVRNSEPSSKPILMTNTITLHHDFQIKQYLLCARCEQEFGDREVHVSSLIKRSDTNFPFSSLLRCGKRVASLPFGEAYSARDIPKIDCEQLAYFAASVVWRGSVREWENFDGTSFRPSPLGPYEEEYRRYLDQGGAFPLNSIVVVYLHDGEPGCALYTSIMKRVFNGLNAHHFIGPGISFVVVVDKQITDDMRSVCIVRGAEQPIGILSNKAPLDASVIEMFKHSRRAASLQK